MLAPKGTPKEIVQRLYAEIAKAQQTPEVKARLASVGADPWILSPEAFHRHIREEVASNIKLATTAGIKAE
jgi:tripartite-type tricarboxylate transporter receptor subunit TctC